MTRARFFNSNLHSVRQSLVRALKLSDQIHILEMELVEPLYRLGQKRMYVRIGYKSLPGFCTFGLSFSRIQSQRIATLVRRYVPTSKMGIERTYPQ